MHSDTAAMFNRAGRLEEAGELQSAIDLYETILERDPDHWLSLARLAYARKATVEDCSLQSRLERAFQSLAGDAEARESLAFALAKIADDCEQYARASTAYEIANELSRKRTRPYNAGQTEAAFRLLASAFNRDDIERHSLDGDAAPVFVCGMYRTGSTLLESMLARHPRLQAGGELAHLPLMIGKSFPHYPELSDGNPTDAKLRLRNAYLAEVQALSRQNTRIIDKRPDNFLHLGMIKMLFPNARVIYTHRQPLDTCLSIYFQQLAGFVNYANDLENLAHYYLQHRALMRHWKTCFGDDIHYVSYESLVHSPQPVLRSVLAYLGLDWDAQMQQEGHGISPVNTASLWQVREKLHTSSVNRARHYPELCRSLNAVFTVKST